MRKILEGIFLSVSVILLVFFPTLFSTIANSITTSYYHLLEFNI